MKKNRLLCLVLAVMMVLSLAAGCAPASEAEPEETPAATPEATPEAAAPAGAWADGTYDGAANGMNGEVAVSVTIEGGAITAVEVTSHNETAGISDPAIEDLPGAIVEAQSAEVDTIAGCTMTSNAIIEGVKIALSKADGSYEGEEEAVAVPESADVVVVGLGFAGMNAALEAANNGADVLVLEKTGSRGGALRLAGGTLSGACTKMQEEAGIVDSPELFYEEIVSRNADIGGEDNYLPDVAHVLLPALRRGRGLAGQPGLRHGRPLGGPAHIVPAHEGGARVLHRQQRQLPGKGGRTA